MYSDILGLKNCYGCGVCAAVCPVEIIGFCEDAAGFYRPRVEQGERCIGCDLCSGSCAALGHAIPEGRRAVRAFSGYSASREERLSSSSGGVARELARQAVEEGALFCGVRYDADRHRAENFLARTPEGVDLSKGSKYMLSYSADALREMFCERATANIVFGLPCQIASIRKYLDIVGRAESYLLVDLFCFGAPSRLLWKKYVADHAGAFSGADTVVFRDKSHGWHDSYRILARRGGQVVYRSAAGKEDAFYRFFLGKFTDNEPCYRCPFRGQNSAADIRLGDMWGEKFEADREGVSVVAVFTRRGREAVDALRNAELTAEDVEVALAGQYRGGPPKPAVRRKILKALRGPLTLEEIYAKYRRRLYLWRLRYRVRRRLRICRAVSHPKKTGAKR